MSLPLKTLLPSLAVIAFILPLDSAEAPVPALEPSPLPGGECDGCGKEIGGIFGELELLGQDCVDIETSNFNPQPGTCTGQALPCEETGCPVEGSITITITASCLEIWTNLNGNGLCKFDENKKLGWGQGEPQSQVYSFNDPLDCGTKVDIKVWGSDPGNCSEDGDIGYQFECKKCTFTPGTSG